MAQRQVARATYPKVGEIFELTMPAGITGLGMVEAFGYTKNWKFTGKTVPAATKQKFMLVQVGYQPNLKSVASACRNHGEVPEGVWMQALDETFAQDGAGPIGIADPSWERPGGHALFPMVNSLGDRSFSWADDFRTGLWRWLVAVK